MKILNIGSLNIDMVYRVDSFLQPGETKTAASLMLNSGGKGLNQSIAAARAGNQVWHGGLVGSDGAFLLDALRENGVDTSLILPMEEKNGHAIIQVDSSGQNCILLYAGTNRMLSEELVDNMFAAFPDNNAVLLQNEVNLLPYIIRRAHEHGHKIFLNAAPMDDNITHCPLELIDWLMVNEIEGRQIANCQKEEDILPVLRERYPQLGLLLTLGERGALCSTGGKTLQVDACKVPVLDTTAAGDTFCGYFMYGVLKGESLETCLKTASAASAVCIGRAGAACSVPRREELEKLSREGLIALPEVRVLA